MTRIMIVEDDAMVRESIACVLSMSGYSVVEACDGPSALRLGVEGVELVVTDIVMPGMSGLELIPLLKLQAPALKVAAVSGGGRIDGCEVLQSAIDAGADAVFRKPFRVKDLLNFVERFTGG